MSDWTSGYVADIGYTFGYYTELNPLRIKLAFSNVGLVFPEVATACELGFGQGISTNLHAASSMVKWYGTDFNPAQAGYARELADISGSGAMLVDEAFEDFVTRTDLPDFDFIGLHGIWSWISDFNRKLIVDFIRRKLKVGGVLFISYNTLPGWAAFAPIRHLMSEHAEIIGAEGRGIISRINDAIEFADKLLETKPIFLRANPLIADRIKKLKDQNRHYLAHEYFNKDWHPMHFASMRDWLQPAKLQYACSAHYIDHIEVVNLTQDQVTFLKSIPDALFRESVRDFMVNQQFRRDYWVKGARKVNPLEQAEIIRKQKVLLTTHISDLPLKVDGARGKADMSKEIYMPILELLSDHKTRSIGDIEKQVMDKNVNFGQLMQAAMILIGSGHVSAAQDEGIIKCVKQSASKLNSNFVQKAKFGIDHYYLGSPVTGGGFGLDRIQLLFLLALSEGKRDVNEWVQTAWQILNSHGQKLMKEGKTLETQEESIAELTAMANRFAQKQLPILKALQIT